MIECYSLFSTASYCNGYIWSEVFPPFVFLMEYKTLKIKTVQTKSVIVLRLMNVLVVISRFEVMISNTAYEECSDHCEI